MRARLPSIHLEEDKMAASSSSIGDSDDDHTLSYIIHVPDMPEQQVPRQRGTRARRRSRGRGRVAGRATSTRAIQQKGGQRGRRVQRGQIRFAEGEADRLRNLQEERKRKANDMIDSLSEERAKKILKSVADKMPSIILDVAEQLSKPTAAEAEPTQQPPAEPGPSAPGPDHQTWPSWCVCRRCREMPSDASRVCCGMRPDLCTSLQPEMSLVITDPHVLQLQKLYRNDIFARHATSVEDINKSNRHAAYRQFILNEYGRLGAHNRRPVPSCCAWYIRDKFPDPNGVYVDYVPMW